MTTQEPIQPAPDEYLLRHLRSDGSPRVLGFALGECCFCSRGREAADRIDSLRRENTRLQERLDAVRAVLDECEKSDAEGLRRANEPSARYKQQHADGTCPMCNDPDNEDMHMPPLGADAVFHGCHYKKLRTILDQKGPTDATD